MTKITASDSAAGDRFGYSASICDNVAIIGANYDNDQGHNSGSAYVMERDVLTGNWKQTAKLTAPDGASDDNFGRSVSVSGNVIVGAYQDDDKGSNSGSVYVYEKDDSTGHWNQMAKLTASDGAAGDN